MDQRRRPGKRVWTVAAVAAVLAGLAVLAGAPTGGHAHAGDATSAAVTPYPRWWGG